MGKASAMTIPIPGVEVWISYLDSNLRITDVEWDLPAGVTAWVRIWNNYVLFYDETFVGPDDGKENVPGTHEVVWDEDFQCYVLPDYITYAINLEVTET